MLPSPAWADKRVALVIGNSAYKNVPKLTNPANDAAAIAGVLQRAGFEVVEAKRDLTQHRDAPHACATSPTRAATRTWRSSTTQATASKWTE